MKVPEGFLTKDKFETDNKLQPQNTVAGHQLIDDPDQLLEEWKNRVLNEELFEPEVVYGYFKCHNRDNKLVVDNPDGGELVFDFPRSSKSKHLCLTDYFGEDDIVAFQSVTVGKKVAEIIEKWDKECGHINDCGCKN